MPWWLSVILALVACLGLVLLVRAVLAVRRARRVLASYASASPVPAYDGERSVRVVQTHRGADLHVEVDGPDDAPLTVVFVHDWTRDLDDWTPQRQALAGSAVRSVYFDLRGHGRSTWRLHSLIGCPRDAFVRDVAAVVDAVAGEGRVLLVGHGLGGQSVLGFVEGFPHRRSQVAAVLLLATGQLTVAAAGAPDVRRLERGLTVLRRLPGPVARLVASPHSTSYAVAARSVSTLGFFDPTAAGEALAGTPVAMVVAEDDGVVPTAGQQTLAGAFRELRVQSVAGLGHHVPVDAADAVNRELSSLVETAVVPPLPAQRRRPLFGSLRTPRATP